MGGLIWLMDICQLSPKDGESIDWEEIVRQARISGWSAAAYYVLQVTREYLGAEYPEGVLIQLKSQIQSQEEKLVLARSVVRQNRAQDGLSNLLGMSRSAQVMSILTNLFPSPKYMCQRYQVRSNWVLPLYYTYRWWDMSRQMIEVLKFRGRAKYNP